MPEEQKPGPGEHRVRRLDAHSLRGLAHPLRMRLLAELRMNGPATASQLAEKTGESSGSTSYHLRQLAAHGFVEDAPERGKGRERWWKSIHQGTTFDRELMDSADPETRGAADLVLHEQATWHTQEMSTWLGTRDRWPDEWRAASDLSDWTLRLTPELGREVSEKVSALIESYRAREPVPGTPDTAQIRFHWHALPRALDENGKDES